MKQKLKKYVPATYKKIDDIAKMIIDNICEIEVRKTPKVMLDFEVQLVEHCNLNCAGCSHFSPLADKEFLDVLEYEKDLKCLSSLFDGEANFIRLMGGEPLLHPELKKIIELTRKYFPDCIIDLDTNGILLLSMNKEFFNVLKENNIFLTITKYPIKLDYKKIEEKCSEEKIKFRYFDNQIVRKFIHLPLDLEGRQLIEKNFYNCYLANCCHTLKHGKMFTCSTVPHVHHFNKYYNCNLKVSKNDYIDIYKVKNKEEILNFLAKPIPFCRYCNVNKRTYNHNWKKSSHDINEWTIKQ